MSNFIDIHTHNPATQCIGLRNYRLGVDTTLPASPFSAGIHPWDADKVSDFESLMADLELLNPSAIGEIGLDFACNVDRKVQQKVFQQQLIVASQQELPVIIHCVKATAETLATLVHHPLRAVIFHGFIGSAEVAKQIIHNGYYLSFGFGALRSPRTIEALKESPQERLFLESDTATEPIEKLYQEVAKLRNTTTEQLNKEIVSNYTKIFQ